MRRTFFFFPIFGRKWSESGRISSYTILWPFFSWGYDKKNGVKEYNLPWPLVQIGDSETPKIKKRIFFPFYGTYTYEKSDTTFVTPLYFSLKKKGARFDSEQYTNFLVVWWYKRNYHVPDDKFGSYWRYFKIWPLFSIEYDDRGYYAFNFLSLLPMRDPEGYELLYEPLWTLFEYRRLRTGEKRLGLLFRTYYQRWSKKLYEMEIPLVIHYKEQQKRVRKVSFLLYMFGYSHTEKGQYLRLFWVPIRVGNSELTAAELGDAGKYDDIEDEVNYYALMKRGGAVQRNVPSSCAYRASLF